MEIENPSVYNSKMKRRFSYYSLLKKASGCWIFLVQNYENGFPVECKWFLDECKSTSCYSTCKYSIILQFSSMWGGFDNNNAIMTVKTSQFERHLL